MKKLEEYNKNRNNNLKTDYDYQLIVHDLIERYGIQNKIDFCILASNWSRNKLDRKKVIEEYNRQKDKR